VDADGHPFPTLYWLTCPEHVRAVASLESEGWIARLNEEAETDPDLRTMLRRAHESYARERERIIPGTGAGGGVGGTARGVKCLHAHYAYLVAGGADPVGAWVAERLAEKGPVHYERPGERLAAIDLGTNSIRLLVVRWADGQLTELARDMVITRIGQGVDRTKRIDPAALARTVNVLRRYCRRARALGATRIRLSATSAVRDAANRDELDRAVLRNTGEPMEVLPGSEEAKISFLGATRDLRDDPRAAGAAAPWLVVDIGGGSTEFILGSDPDAADAAISVDMGSVRLTERFVRADPPAPDELATMQHEIDKHLDVVEQAVPVDRAATLVAVAGTSTTVQAIVLALPEYDPERLHRSWLELPDAERVAGLLADMTTAERRAIPSMAPGREDVIPAGAAILVGVMRRWGFDRAIVSETDILDGLAWRLIAEADGPSANGSPQDRSPNPAGSADERSSTE
jgi:exopolyphosphatase/guanosine-5'-triphosphate,3'-diphosphate pyrophosphatase